MVNVVDAIVCCADNFEIFCSVVNALAILQEIFNNSTWKVLKLTWSATVMQISVFCHSL
jgi:hypothetical protein